MALIRCPECKKRLSTLASTCPGCGAPVSAAGAEQSHRRARNRGILLVGILTLVGYSFLKGKTPEPAPAEPAMSSPSVGADLPPPPSHLPKILDGAVTRIDAKNYPKTYQKLGADAAQRANELAPKVAELVSRADRCVSVQLVELSNRATKSQLQWFVDCTNGTRYYVTEQMVKAGTVPSSNAEKLKAADTFENHALCEAMIKSSLHFPSSYSREQGGVQASVTPTGEIVIRIAFTAKNGIGLTVPQIGECALADGKMRLEGIGNR